MLNLQKVGDPIALTYGWSEVKGMSILARLKRWVVGLAPRPGPPPGMYESPLDRLSNSVLDAIEAGNYDEAENLCRRLLREYPKALDGHERLAILREAQGRFQEAAEQYSKVLKTLRKNPKGTDSETVRHITDQRDQMLAKAKP